MKTVAALILCASFLWSCTTVKVAHFNGEERLSTFDIDIYANPASVKREYKEIALITADDNDWGKSEAGLIEKVKEKAMEIGADAIVLQPVL